jgi:uncharacterized surface anchored protein
LSRKTCILSYLCKRSNDFLEEVPPVLYKLSGTVYNDTNAPGADGIKPTDAPIAGVTVELFNVDAAGQPTGSAIATATTDATGKYEFTDLADGNYVVVETQPAGFDTVTSNQIAVTIAGADSVNNDFLEEVPPVLYKLSGTVYNDTNAPGADGIEPTDAPIAGVTVELFNVDAAGQPTGSAIASAITDATGKYEFTDLADGNYVVVETQPAGYETVTDVDGGNSNQIAATTTDENGFYSFSNLANGSYVVIERQPSGYYSVTDIDGTDDNHVFVNINGVDSIANNFLRSNSNCGDSKP